MLPAHASQEAARLQALQSYAILDTPPEEAFDQLAQLAAHIFDVPIAIVNLVDQQRQWFKAVEGLDVCETDREVAFCNYTILGREIFEVCDAREDPAFRDNPLVTGPPFQRYYAGAPIVYDGMRIGALCLIDFEPRPPLTDDQRAILTDLADIVVREIQVQRMLKESIALLADV